VYARKFHLLGVRRTNLPKTAEESLSGVKCLTLIVALSDSRGNLVGDT
jgi:hypothetical protein